MPASPKLTGRAKAEARRDRVMSLTTQGHSTRQIAARVGVSHRTVCKDIHARLDAQAKECPETSSYRELQRTRINRLLSVWYPRAIKGESEATDKTIKLLENEARLLGLNLRQEVPDRSGAAVINKYPTIKVEFTEGH